MKSLRGKTEILLLVTVLTVIAILAVGQRNLRC